ncbi:hypothetical protein B1748_21110 [Paenibacillus sp. MY03]|nr:hypothetical protein B1748_21110 [Paenibacillus sp. MY03]
MNQPAIDLWRRSYFSFREMGISTEKKSPCQQLQMGWFGGTLLLLLWELSCVRSHLLPLSKRKEKRSQADDIIYIFVQALPGRGHLFTERMG